MKYLLEKQYSKEKKPSTKKNSLTIDTLKDIYTNKGRGVGGGNVYRK